MLGGLAQTGQVVMPPSMPFDQEEFLARVLEKAGTKAKIGRILDYPSSRVAEMYKPNTTKRLTMKEGMALAEALDLWPAEPVSVESLSQVLRVALRYSPPEWTDQAVERLAQDVLIGLDMHRYLRAGSSPPASPGEPKERPGEHKPA